jgi:hypothetical protein
MTFYDPVLAPRTIRALDRAMDDLKTALAPFAALEIDDRVPDEALVIVTNTSGGIIDTGKNMMTVGDIRRARRAFLNR